MSRRQECIDILGPEVAAQAIAEALAQPGPDPELIEFLRPLFCTPPRRRPSETPQREAA